MGSARGDNVRASPHGGRGVPSGGVPLHRMACKSSRGNVIGVGDEGPWSLPALSCQQSRLMSTWVRPLGPAGWATVRLWKERPGYGWQAGHRAGTLTALFMLATGTEVAGCLQINRPVT